MVGEIAARMLKSLDSIVANVWRYGLVKADHYRPIEEQNLIQPLLTIPLVSVSFLSVGGAKQNKNGNNI